jgi:hypothetical protein
LQDCSTDFEFLPIDVSLGRCQRYYEKTYQLADAGGTNTNEGSQRVAGSTDGSTNFVLYSAFSVRKRATPTITFYTPSGTSGSWAIQNTAINTDKTVNALGTGEKSILVYFNFGSAQNWVSAYVWGHWLADSEL